MTRRVIQVSKNNQIDQHLTSASRRNKRIGALLIFGALLAALIASALFPSELNTGKMGVHLMLDDGRNVWDRSVWRDHLAHAAQVGDYVTQLVRSSNLDVEQWQYFMGLCEEFELKPILRLATTFNLENDWWEAPTPDPNGGYASLAQQYAAFIAALDWPDGAPHYVIIGNEPNHGDEWGGRPDPAAYARFLIDTAAAIHAADPQAVVLNGALDWYTPHTGSQPFTDGQYYMDAETFMDEMFLAEPGVFEVIDVWASHAYAMTPPWEQTHAVDLINDAANPNRTEPPRYVYNRGVNSYMWEFYKLSTLGFERELPIMITETGWRHDTYTPEQVAQFTDLAYQGNYRRYPGLPEVGWTPWLNDNRVIAVTPFALNGHPSEWEQFNWVEVDESGNITATRPVFDAMTELHSR